MKFTFYHPKATVIVIVSDSGDITVAVEPP